MKRGVSMKKKLKSTLDKSYRNCEKDSKTRKMLKNCSKAMEVVFVFCVTYLLVFTIPLLPWVVVGGLIGGLLAFISFCCLFSGVTYSFYRWGVDNGYWREARYW